MRLDFYGSANYSYNVQADAPANDSDPQDQTLVRFGPLVVELPLKQKCATGIDLSQYSRVV